jgi:CBS domain-containing protein
MGTPLIEETLAAADSVGAVARAADAMRTAVTSRVAAGEASAALTADITAFNDAATHRLIALVGAAPSFAADGACWIALGSQGRAEQTIASDQDNALLFADSQNDEATRDRLAPWAARVNDALDECGLARCRGNIMAGNREWCLAEREWRERFAAWLRAPDPGALLNAVVFFDFRGIAGDTAATARLRAWLAPRAAEAGGFLVALARNALENGPPLGLFGRLAPARSGPNRGSLDLKTNGVQPFVEAARVYALATGAVATNTPARLREAVSKGRLRQADAAACIAAFDVLQRTRLTRNAQQLGAGRAPDNLLEPRSLDPVAVRDLRGAFGTARALQARLARDFALAAPAFGA